MNMHISYEYISKLVYTSNIINKYVNQSRTVILRPQS